MYNHLGPFPGTFSAVSAIQDAGKELIVVTNNTTSYVDLISKKFMDHGIDIPSDHIISSGLGLVWDEPAHTLVHKKKVYVYGWETSGQYVTDAGGIVVADLEEAEVICFAASEKDDNEPHCRAVIEYMTKYPQVEGICINSDHYVIHEGEHFPVIGFYADLIEKAVPQSFYWVGKPESNMSGVVQKIMRQRFNTVLTDRAWFFDDNVDNVQQFVIDLSVSGCVVLDTGLSLLSGFSGSNYSDLFNVSSFSI